MKSEAEIREVLTTLHEAHQWALRNSPRARSNIASLEDRIGLLEWMLGMYDDQDSQTP